MRARHKFYIAALALLALGILLIPSVRRPTASPGTNERSRSISREPHSPPPAIPRHAKSHQSLVKFLNNFQPPTLTHQEIDGYVQAQGRSVGSLLAAFRLSRDEAYLTEALAEFPNNPEVLLCALRITIDPAKQMALIESIKQADPNNGIGNCLAAKALFDRGEDDEALTELLQSSGKTIQDFTAAAIQNTEEAYLLAGFSPVEAKVASAYGASRPEVVQMSSMRKSLEKLRDAYASAGDDTAVLSVREIQSELGRHLQEDSMLIGELVGIALEKSSLKGVDTPAAVARLEEIDQQKTSLVESARKVAALMQDPGVPEGDWLLYFDRVKIFGEKAANAWLQEKHLTR